MQSHTDDSSHELLTLTAAVREARGRASYQTLWRGIQAGRIAAIQPYGPGGHYRIARAELERVLQPVRPRAEK